MIFLKKHVVVASLLALSLDLISAPGFAEEVEEKTTFWTQDTLTGDWGGLRSRLSDKGIDLEFVYTGEVMGNVSGGVEKEADYLDNVDLLLAVDAEKLISWKGASFFLYGLGNQGGSPSLNSGDTQGVSNIESPDGWKLYEAWYQQKLFDDKFSILMGLYDLNSEFDVIETGSLFILSSHGIGPDFSQSGLNGPSIFPVTSLAGRVRLEPKKWIYFQTAILDGVPGDLNATHTTQVDFSDGDGALIAFEAGFLPGEMKEDAAYGKVAVGSWYYTGNFDDLTDTNAAGNPLSRQNNFGVYVLGEYTVYREADDHKQGLSIFGRFGYANTNINPVGYYIGAGAVYTGLIPKRNADQLGVAVASAINGGKFMNAQRTAGTPVERTETNIEVSYKAQITPWFAVQPDIQYIMNPGTNPALKNALQVASRFEISF